MHTDDETAFVRTLLFTLATVLPLLDAVVIVSRIGVGPELFRHAAILFVLAIVSVSLWRSTRSPSSGS